jgi:hypothetical protein
LRYLILLESETVFLGVIKMKKITGFTLACAVLSFSAVASAETVYESTDDSGVVEFSGEPSADSVPVEVTPNVIDVTPPPASEVTAAPAAVTPPASTRQTVEIYHYSNGAEETVTEEEALRRERLLERNDAAVRRDEAARQDGARQGGEAVHHSVR